MPKMSQLIIADYTKDNLLSLTELCEICGITVTLVEDYVSYEVLQPKVLSQEEWAFDLSQLERMQKALRLQRDFELNLAGVALVLDLLDEVGVLRERLVVLEKHTLK